MSDLTATNCGCGCDNGCDNNCGRSIFGGDNCCCNIIWILILLSICGNGSFLGVNIEYRLECDALGTAGGVKNCSDFIKDDDFLVISGDCVCDFDLRRLMEFHKKQNSIATMAQTERMVASFFIFIPFLPFP